MLTGDEKAAALAHRGFTRGIGGGGRWEVGQKIFLLLEGVGWRLAEPSPEDFFPVFADPGFPAFAGGGVAAAEGERRDIGVGNFDWRAGIFGAPAVASPFRPGGRAIEGW